MQQSPPLMIPMVLPSFPPTNITTDQIQKYLDENKKLITAILENENLGKLAECAQYQALLQKNLMYLAAIADAQPQPSTTTPPLGPMTPLIMGPPLHQSPMQPPPSYFMQQNPQTAGLAQQLSPGIFPSRGGSPLQFGSIPHHQFIQNPQHQQQGYIGITRPMGLNHNNNNNGLQHLTMHNPETLLGSSVPVSNDVRGGHKPDGADVNQSGADGQGGSASRHGSGDGKKLKENEN